MEAEAARVRQAAEKALHDAILSSWASADPDGVLRVLGLSELLHGAPAYPDAWLAHCLAAIDRPEVNRRVRMLDAELRGEWQVVAEHAEALIAAFPYRHDLQWHLGRAAYHLGDWPRARAALRIFVAEVRDSPDLAAAERLLAEAAR
jgi:hypothetical protein